MCQTEILARQFYDLFNKGRIEGSLEISPSELSLEEAYEVQDRVAELRLENGEEIVGYKVGCTSRAIREQFGLEEPISGRLFSPHVHQEGISLRWIDYVNCSIEPEMVLKIGQDLVGEELSDAALIDSVEWVSPGIEVHHFKFWHSPVSSQELIASNGIHACLVVGESRVSPRALSFRSEEFRVILNGQPAASGMASEIMGSPIESLRRLVGQLTRRGDRLKGGEIVIPGSPVELVPIDSETTLRVEIDGVGGLETRFN